MRTLYLLNLDGSRYGIWKDEIASITDVQTIHRIPLSPDCIAGVSVIDGRSTALADLGACIGLRDRPVWGPVKVFFVAGKKNDSGFVISGGVEEMDVPPDAVHPLPGYLKTPGNDTCVLQRHRPIPVINLAALYDRIHERSTAPIAPALSVPASRPAMSAGSRDIQLFKAGGEIFAFPGDQMQGRPATMLPDGIARITLAPRYVKGLACHQESVLPVISLAERMGLPARRAEKLMAVAELSGARFGFLIDEYLGSVDGADIRPLPPAASTGWASAAVLHRGEVIPLLEPAVLLTETDREEAVKRLPDRYSPEVRFLEAFERTNVNVMEFSLLGVRHALPRTEVEDIVPFKPYRRVPDSLPIVIGITEHNGAVLPVLDLAMVFGRRSLETPEWKMILVKNGDFSAFVITERLYDERMLPRDVQRKVPIVLPHTLVYGCYPEGVAVRLILNVEALTVHFDKSVVRDLLPALTSEMAAAPSELVPSLLPEEHLKEEAAAASRPEAPGEEDQQGGPKSWQEQAEDAMLMRMEAEQLARQEAEAKARAEAEENLYRAREEELRRQAVEEQARREAEEGRKRLETEERTRKEAEEQAHRQAEAQEQRVAEEQKKIEEETLARREAEEQTRRAEEDARRAAEEKARLAEEEQARITAEEQRKIEEQNRVLQEAQECSRREAEEQARRDAEGKARKESEELSRRTEEEKARRGAEEARREAEELSRRAEEEATRRAAEEKARFAAEEQARKAAEEQERIEAEERARRAAEELARREAAAASKREAEEQARRAAEEQKRIEEEARARQEALERARREAEAEAKRLEEERKRAAAAAISEAKKISRERERETVQAANRTIGDRAPSPSDAAPSPEGQPLAVDRQDWKKYVVAAAAGILLVTLLYVSSQKRSDDDRTGSAIVRDPKTEQAVRQEEGSGKSSLPDAGKQRTSAANVPEKKPGQDIRQGHDAGTPAPDVAKEKKESAQKGALVLTVPPDRPLEIDIYIVKKGDTLWVICKRFTGNPFNYPRVARDNSIANPDLIFPGQRVHLKK